MNRELPSGRPTADRGVALLIVITILVTMVLVAVPFALSMRQGQERTEAAAARSRAMDEADKACEFAKLFLGQTHPYQEELRRQLGQDQVDANALVDSLDEITPTDAFRKKIEEEILQEWAKDPKLAAKAEYLESRGLGPLNDDRGSIWSVQVEDAQARVNVNGASPFLLGNLLGAALLSDDLGTDSGDISVQHVTTGAFGSFSGFPPEGGYIRIGNEVISYESFEDQVFRGCKRGVLQETPLGDNGSAATHRKGAPVIDYTAYKLATHIIARRPGSLTLFRNLEALRDIASWGADGVITASRLERILPFLTVWSRRETSSGFLAEQLVVNALPDSAEGGPEEVRLNDKENPTGTPAYFNPGTIARFTDGVDTVYQVVAAVGDDDGGQRGVLFTSSGRVNAFDESIAFKGGSTRVAAMAPYPININTASRDVLYAVMANIQLWRADSDDKIVTPKLAWRLAGELVEARKGKLQVDPDSGLRKGGPFRSAEDWCRWLEDKLLRDEQEFGRDQLAALYLNAINPHSAMLRFGTAPWCYRTLDVYHIESRVVINNRAGEQIAEAAVREVVEIGSDATASWVLDSQDDFEYRLAMGSGGKWVTTFPFGVAYKSKALHHIQPALRGPKAWARGIFAYARRGQGLGDARLEPARMLLKTKKGDVVDHFDHATYAEGHYTEWDRRYAVKTKDAFMKMGDTRIRPFSMSFWWRPYSRRNWTVFDTGIEQFENRLALFVQDGEEGQELTFRCCAGNRWRQGAELYVPLEQLDYEPGTWYHIQVSCHGEDPATMQMLVDGVDLARRRAFTVLSGSISEDNDEIPVDSTDGFPVRGAIRIGPEIIEYDTLTGSSFRDCRRGARGTRPAGGEYNTGRAFPAGTPVHVLGYSMPLTLDITRGGGVLTEPLYKWTAMRISTIDSGNAEGVVDFDPIKKTNVQPNDPLPELLFRGFPRDLSELNVTCVPMWDQEQTKAENAFGEEGIALLGCWDPQTDDAVNDVPNPGEFEWPDEKFGGWEVVSYTRDGAEFTIDRDFDTPEEWGVGEDDEKYEDFDLVTEWLNGPDGPLEWAAILVPISIRASTSGSVGGGYLDPADGETDLKLRRAAGLPDEPVPDLDTQRAYAARVCLARPAEDNEPQQEVICYDTLDLNTAEGILFISYRYVNLLKRKFYGGPEVDTSDSDEPEPTPEPIDPSESETDDGTPTEPEDFEDEPAGEVLEPEEHDEESDGTGEPGLEDSEDGEGSGEALPPPEEPKEDQSGGGGDYGEDEDDAGDEGDSKVPKVPHGEFDPEDPPPEDDPPSDEDDTAYSIPPPSNGLPLDVCAQYWIGRAQNGTMQLDHEGQGSSPEGEANFLPCFRVREVSYAPARMGRNDVITITDGAAEAPTRVEAGVRWADHGSDWVALNEFVDARIAAPNEDRIELFKWRDDSRGRPRVLKFPCGEMPDDRSEELEFGESSISSTSLVTAFLDELHIWKHPLDPPVRVDDIDGVSTEADEIRLRVLYYAEYDPAELEGYDPDCGVFLLEGELIVYRGIRMEGPTIFVLERCERGQFGTKAAFHPITARGRFLPEIPVSYLEAGMTTEAATVPMARTRGWPSEGLARILREDTAELVHYTRIGERELIMPVSLDPDTRTRDRGLFRGRFGTEAIDHDTGEIVVFQPFRYWDRFVPRRSEGQDTFSGVHDHPDASYVELGKKARSAYWRGFRWLEELTGRVSATKSGDRSDGRGEDQGYLDIMVLARFNPGIPWDTTKIVDLREKDSYGSRRDLGKMARDHLFLFDDPGEQPIGPTVLNDPGDLPGMGNRIGLESDTAEFRVYFVYKPNAFDPIDDARRSNSLEDVVMRNDWKQSPWLRKFTLNYFSRTMTRYRAPLR